MTAPRIVDLAGIDLEDGVSLADGLPFILVRARDTTGELVMVGQLRPDTVRAMALDWLETAEAAEADAALAMMLRAGRPDAGAELEQIIGAALVAVHHNRLEQKGRIEQADR